MAVRCEKAKNVRKKIKMNLTFKKYDQVRCSKRSKTSNTKKGMSRTTDLIYRERLALSSCLSNASLHMSSILVASTAWHEVSCNSKPLLVIIT